MPQQVEDMLDGILRREGGYVDHPADRGGPTKYGITQATLSAWLASQASVKEMHEDVARLIYRLNYYQKPRIDQLPPVLQPFVFDCAVHHGPDRAARFLQQTLRELGHDLRLDGKIGPVTSAAAADAVAEHGGRVVLDRLIERRRAFYQAIVQHDGSQAVFLKGWLNRLAEFEQPDAVLTA